MSLVGRITSAWRGFRGPTLQQRRYAAWRAKRYSAIVAANREGGGRGDAYGSTRGGSWPGVPSNRNEDALNKEYAYARADVIQRSQDLDVNNPDIGGFHRTRTSQIVGNGVTFEHAPHADEIGQSPRDAANIAAQVNRLRELHSRTGGFDSTGMGYTEGKQQERAVLTMLVNGDCLIHRVWRPDHPILPLALELIPGVRISTPYQHAGDPLVSYGVRYSEPHRTQIVGYYVRRVSATIGDSFVPEYQWDLVPVEDCILLALTEQAGLDRSMPVSMRVSRMARNRGEFIEAAVEAARTQAKYYAVTEVAPGSDPYNTAYDDSSFVNERGEGFTDLGDGVKHKYVGAGEKMTWASSKLPDPDFTGFMGATDERMARGMPCSLSTFTHKVDNSFAGGRLEDQHDDPLVTQYRESFVGAWQRVNEWFLEAVYLSDKVDLPGYSAATKCYWTEFDSTFPGKVHINPTDTQSAREKGLMQRSTTPQRICKEDGLKLRKNLVEWAKFYQMRDEVAAEYAIDPALLDIQFSGKSISTSTGAQIAPPAPETETSPTNDGNANGHANGAKKKAWWLDSTRLKIA